ncbi:MAG: TlpA family protein disulfide reductase [Lachnospiraceae bacterium]|nr:TlpA family protein disulfide reductase [Lachnospiraceae bacterium]
MTCAIFITLLSGCGKSAQEEKAQESIQTEAEETSGAGEEGGTDLSEQSEGIAFETQDLEGNTVTESAFAQSRLTMVNVWATYCNPCLSEMPGLGELAGEYDAGQFQIIGIVSDVQEGAGEEAVEYATALVSQTGADYMHLLLNESLYRAMLGGVSAVPTTFFVDENGEVLDTIVGAMDKSAWKEKIDAFLEE